MSNIVSASKTVVIRTRRDTLGLVVAASALTFALAFSVHTKRDRLPLPPAQETQLQLAPPTAPEQQDWAGHLAELKSEVPTAPSEPLSSAALVVPKSQLALPPAPRAARSTRACADGPCSTIARTPTAPTRRPMVAADAKGDQPTKPKKSLLGMLNPLNHLPDVSVVSRPFTYAGGTVAGWFKRL